MRNVKCGSLKKKMLCMLLAFAVLTSCLVMNASTCYAAGKAYYVDNAVEVSGNGETWDTAYKNFSDIVWSNINPGDTIYISGGPSGSSKTYNETWSVGASGSAGLPITITVDGSDPRHNGTVIFDYDSYGDRAEINGAITLINRDYITISGDVNGENHIVIKNLRDIIAAHKACAFYGYGNSAIIIDHVNVINCNNGVRLFGFDAGESSEVRYCNFLQMRGDAAVKMEDLTNLSWDLYKIHHNYIEMLYNKEEPPDVTDVYYYGPDGIQGGNGTTVYNNTFKVTVTSSVYTSGQHVDSIQFGCGRYYKIYNNEFINVGDAALGFGIWYDNFHIQDIYVYNNIFRIEDEIDDYPDFFRIYGDPSGKYKIAAINNVKIINNLFLDGGNWPGIFMYNYPGNPTASGNEIRNNIFYNTPRAIEIQPSSGFTSESFSFSNNIYYPSDTNIKLNGTSYSATEWQSQMEPTAKTTAPEFVLYEYRGANNDLHLSPSDTVARDNGTSLSTLFACDKDGVERPQGTAWDIGPYEYEDDNWYSKADWAEGRHILGSDNTGVGESGVLTVQFDVIPLVDYTNVVMAYSDSSTNVVGYEDNNMIVQLAADGTFKVMNETSYQRSASVPYSSGNTYHVRMVARLAEGTYDVWVTPPGGTETQIAGAYAFRTSAPPIDDLGQIAIRGGFDNEAIVFNHVVEAGWYSKVDWAEGRHSLGSDNTGEGEAGVLTVQFDVMPLVDYTNVVMAYSDSSTNVVGYEENNMIVQLAADGTFKVMNATAYQSSASVPYSSGNTYHVRMVARLAEGTYDVWVTPPGGEETQIASAYAFRASAPPIDDIGQIAIRGGFDNEAIVFNHVIEPGFSDTPDIPDNPDIPTPEINLAYGIIPTTNGTASEESLARITNGNTSSQDYCGIFIYQTPAWIKLDLGESYDISLIKLWNYWNDGRQFHDVIVQLSNTEDFSSGVTTVFNNDTDNSAGQGVGTDAEYAETSEGKSISFAPVRARYVRIFTNGSSANLTNYFVEVEVYGTKPIVPELPDLETLDFPGESLFADWNGLESVVSDMWDCNWGIVFSTAVPGYITHIRAFGVEGESGDHTAYIWDNEYGTIVGGPYTINYTGSNEWVEYELPEAIPVYEPGKFYTMIVTSDPEGRYPYVQRATAQAGSNGVSLYYPANAGVFGPAGATLPTVSWRYNYLRDIVFVPASVNPVVEAVNAAADLASMRTAIELYPQWLEQASYNRLNEDDKNQIAQMVLGAKRTGYENVAEIQEIVDIYAGLFVDAERAAAVAQVNAAGDAEQMGQALANPFLEMSFTLYETLSAEQKTTILDNMVNTRPLQGYANAEDIRDNFDSLIKDLLYSKIVPWDQDFFPIGVWMQNPSRALEYKELGFNTYVNLSSGANGFNENVYNALKNSGMKAIIGLNQYARNNMDKALEVAIGWFTDDEPDNAQYVNGWFEIPIPPKDMQDLYAEFKIYDQTLPVYLNLGRGVADPAYNGRGADRYQTDMYPEYSKAADIISFDIYCVNEGYDLTYLAKGIDNLREYSDGKQPVWVMIETTRQKTEWGLPNPEQVKAQAWIALVHGVNGIQFFVHQMSPFIEAGVFDPSYSDIKDMVASINKQITELAPVLNSPTTTGYASVSSDNEDVSIHMMTKKYNNDNYIFSVNVDENSLDGDSTTGTFSVASGTYVEVLGEDREIPIVNNQFSDTFGPHEVHLYRVISSTDIQADSVNIEEESITLQVGNTRTITATVLPENASNKALEWTSSDELVATVDSNGLVTAVSAGTATITVRVAGTEIQDTCIVTVQPAQAEGITITVLDEVAPEKNFSATIGFNLDKEILTAGFTVTYNPDLVTYTGRDAIDGGLYIAGVKHDKNNGTIRVLLSGTDGPITSSTPLITLKFRSKETEGYCEIAVTDAELLDVPGSSTFPAPVSKTVRVNKVIPGDANDDGVNNLRDLHFVSTHFWKDTTSPDWDVAKAADFVKDGRIGIEDLVYVASRILNQ